eukprot:snap_masked-scaffold_77-processed-gene-0.20-mRNA-1 protein AED:1.00 eAED:1.00 QI:0/0/0/0/1/1/4/0/700
MANYAETPDHQGDGVESYSRIAQNSLHLVPFFTMQRDTRWSRKSKNLEVPDETYVSIKFPYNYGSLKAKSLFEDYFPDKESFDKFLKDESYLSVRLPEYTYRDDENNTQNKYHHQQEYIFEKSKSTDGIFVDVEKYYGVAETSQKSNEDIILLENRSKVKVTIVGKATKQIDFLDQKSCLPDFTFSFSKLFKEDVFSKIPQPFILHSLYNVKKNNNKFSKEVAGSLIKYVKFEQNQTKNPDKEVFDEDLGQQLFEPRRFIKKDAVYIKQSPQHFENNLPYFVKAKVTKKEKESENPAEQIKPMSRKKRSSHIHKYGSQGDIIPIQALREWSPDEFPNLPSFLPPPKPEGVQSGLWDRIQEAYEKRPIWVSTALASYLNITVREVNRYMPYFATKASVGAFSQGLIRYGYNPRLPENKISRIYQVMRIESLTRTQLDSYEKNCGKPLTLFGYPIMIKTLFQICDIRDLAIRKILKFKLSDDLSYNDPRLESTAFLFIILENPDLRVFGWINSRTLFAIRNQIKKLIFEKYNLGVNSRLAKHNAQSAEEIAVSQDIPSWENENWKEEKLPKGKLAHIKAGLEAAKSSKKPNHKADSVPVLVRNKSKRRKTDNNKSSFQHITRDVKIDRGSSKKKKVPVKPGKKKLSTMKNDSGFKLKKKNPKVQINAQKQEPSQAHEPTREDVEAADAFSLIGESDVSSLSD